MGDNGTKQREGKAGDLIRWRLKKELPAVRLNDRTSIIGEWWAAAPFDAAADDAARDRFWPRRLAGRDRHVSRAQGAGRQAREMAAARHDAL